MLSVGGWRKGTECEQVTFLEWNAARELPAAHLLLVAVGEGDKLDEHIRGHQVVRTSRWIKVHTEQP